jgi:pimeloyl-ACP methyl ester carboxylesterase
MLLHVCVQSTEALHSLLPAVPDMAPGPYIIVGHSAGGQLALQYAAKHRNDVPGLALLDRWVTVRAAGNMNIKESGTGQSQVGSLTGTPACCACCRACGSDTLVISDRWLASEATSRQLQHTVLRPQWHRHLLGWLLGNM